MRLIILVSLCFLTTGIFAQKTAQEQIDSIVHLLPSLREDTMIMKAFDQVGKIYLTFNPAKGIEYADQALAMAEKMHWKRGIARELNLLGLLVGDTGNSVQARLYFERSSAIQREIHNSWGLISSLNNIGRIYERESNFTEAIDKYYEALTIAEEIKSDTQIALVGSNLTSIYIAQGNLDKGLNYARMTLKHAQLAPMPEHIGKAFEFLGHISGLKKDTATAKSYYQKALKEYEKSGDSSLISQALTTMGPLEYPNYRKAILLLLNAQKILDAISPYSFYSIGNLGQLATSYLELAKQSSKREKNILLIKSEFYLNRAVVICREINNKQYLGSLYATYAQLEEMKGNSTAALAYLKNSISINDSLFSQEKKNGLANMENKHNIDLKNKEIAINQIELVNQRRAKFALIIGLALVGIIGALLFWQNRMRKKSNTTLMVLNNQLDEANKVKTKFFGILSHDLRSPISSLINYLHLLKNEPDLLSAKERIHYQHQIGQSTEELLQTLETILIWSKEQMDNFKPDIRMVAVGELFSYIQKFFSQVTEVQMSFSDPESLQVSADENYLKVIMQNLTSNAIKSLIGKPGGTITWKARKDGLKTILSITDNGPGISAEQIRVLYTHETGLNARTGFGFHIIRDLAKAIQYHISIESTPGMGTTFVLSS